MVPVAAGDGAGLGGVPDVEPLEGEGYGVGCAYGVCGGDVGWGWCGIVLRLALKANMFLLCSNGRNQMTKAEFLQMLRDGDTHRKQFSSHSGVQKNKTSPTFSVPFDCGLVRHFTDKTGYRLTWNARFGQFYCFLRTGADIDAAEAWEKAQGTRVFIRSLLDSVVALDVNFLDNSSGQKTYFGSLEEAAKYHADSSAIEPCASALCELVRDVEHLRSANVVCAVPAAASKGFDAPREITALLSKMIGKPNVTGYIRLTAKAKSAKECSLEEKWDVWANAEVDVDTQAFSGKKVIIVDDKYQSGVTMHVVAQKLRENGAAEVHGVCVVKTLRDTDNVDVVDS